MKQLILCSLAAVLLANGVSLHAQENIVLTPVSGNRQEGLSEIRFGVGVRGPVDRTLGWGSSEIISVSYAKYGVRNLGWRIGAEFMPENMGIDSYFGVPVAFTARTRARSFSQAVTTGLESAAMGAVRDAVYGYEPTARSIVGDFLLGLFNRAEFFAGLTPGYIAGTNVPLKGSNYDSFAGQMMSERTMLLNNRFSLTADAGFSMSFRIWRFNLGFVPSVHYFLTKNFIHVSTTSPIDPGDSGVSTNVTETPVRFQFSVLGALSYTF